MNKQNVRKSVVILAIGVMSPVFIWILMKSLANNSSSSHDPDPWVQTLVDTPKTFTKNAVTDGWFKILSKDGNMFWENEPGALKALTELPAINEKTIFVVEATGPTAASQFYHFLKERELLKKVLIMSLSDGFLKDVQFYDGNLQLSCGQAYLIRFRMLDQLGLANLMKTNMSAVLLEPTLFEKDLDAFVESFKMRRVPIFMIPKSDALAITKVNILAQ